MEKIQFKHLDIPIIRSCNLACVGCITHSNHKNIKGTVRLEESREWLKFWASKLKPETVTLFGGEPLLHPELAEWAEAMREIWGPWQILACNTNGYYIDKLYDLIPRLFNGAGLSHPANAELVGLHLIVSVQTGIEPYLSKVKENIETLKDKIVEWHLTQPGVTDAYWHLWLDEYDINYKRWYRLMVNGMQTPVRISTCDQYKLSWCSHYKGTGENMEPMYDYNDSWYEENHSHCQARDFVTLHRGTMWKCPPIGVLENTLTTFDIDKRPDWAPYLQEYKTVSPTSTDEEIIAWFDQRNNPEKVCNMCGFAGPKSVYITADDRNHELKNYWKYTL